MKKLILPLLLVLFFLALYFPALPGGLTAGDGAELVYGIKNFRTVHPPGYPLYLVLGRAFIRLTGLSWIFGLHFLSALFGAFGLTFFYCFLKLRDISRENVFFAVLTAGFLFPLWSVCTKVEVYSLAFLFFTGSLYFYEKTVDSQWRGYLLWFWVGLSLTHHPVALFNLLLPLDLCRRRKQFPSGLQILLFLLPGLLYLTLLLPTNAPPFNWPLTGNLPALINHMTGGSFHKFFLAGGLRGVLKQLGGILIVQLAAFSPLPAIVLVYGVMGLEGRERWLIFVHLGLIVLLSLYVVPDFSDFLLPAYALCTLYFARGLERVKERFSNYCLAGVIFFCCLTFIIFTVYLDLPYWRSKRPVQWKNYASVVDENVRSGVILSDWYHYAPLRFYQLESGYLKDVRLVSGARLLDKWPRLIKIYRRYNQTVYTTINDWPGAKSWNYKQKGFVYLIKGRRRHG